MQECTVLAEIRLIFLLSFDRVPIHDSAKQVNARNGHERCISRAKHHPNDGHQAQICTDEEQVCRIGDLPAQRQEKADEHDDQDAFVLPLAQLCIKNHAKRRSSKRDQDVCNWIERHHITDACIIEHDHQRRSTETAACGAETRQRDDERNHDIRRYIRNLDVLRKNRLQRTSDDCNCKKPKCL